MTPKPPSSPGGSSLPPRHRPSIDNLVKDTTELDLWAFEEELEPSDVQKTDSRGENPPQASPREIPEPAEPPATPPRASRSRPAAKAKQAPTEDRIRMNVNKPRGKGRPAGPAVGPSKTESDFDDLEHWDDTTAPVPEFEDLDLPGEELPAPVMHKPVSPAEAADIPLEPVDALPDETATQMATSAMDDEFSPVMPDNAKPISLRPHLELSKAERIGLISLLALLLIGAGTFLMFSLNRLPTESAKAEANDFPIIGSQITIQSATSYWRAPITEGPQADTFRRGTQLLPVLELSASGGSAAIRVLFRNDERTVVGDAVTRTIRAGSTLSIPATAGFEDIGMHAAYRTGESKPWTIEVYEAPSETAEGKQFKRLFEMNISTDRR